MLEFFRKQWRSEMDSEETGTFADATWQMTELQREALSAREEGHQAYQRDYGVGRQVYRRSMGFA